LRRNSGPNGSKVAQNREVGFGGQVGLSLPFSRLSGCRGRTAFGALAIVERGLHSGGSILRTHGENSGWDEGPREMVEKGGKICAAAAFLITNVVQPFADHHSPSIPVDPNPSMAIQGILKRNRQKRHRIRSSTFVAYHRLHQPTPSTSSGLEKWAYKQAIFS